MSKIYIFGDSYGDYNYNHNSLITPWYKQLENKYLEKYKIENYCVMGTGPHYSFKKYYDLMLFFDSRDIIIFILSGELRINFPGLNDTQNYISWDIVNKKSLVNFEQNKKVKHYYDLFRNEIDFFYSTYESELIYANEKSLSFLYMMSKIKNIKTMVFVQSDILIDGFQKVNNNLFYFQSFPLKNISDNEIKNEHRHLLKKYNAHDKRMNHLSKENHDVLFHKISSFIEETNCDKEYRYSYKDFDECYEYKQLDDKITYDFIYE